MSVKRNKSIVALLLVVSMVMSMLPMSSVQAVEESIPKQGWYNTEENTGDMNRVPYNNPSQIADLNMGMCSYPVVVDMNEDGIMDLLVYGGAVAEEQVKIFYGTEKGGLVMEKGRKLNPDGYATYPFTATYLYDEEGNYEKTGLHLSGAGKTGAYDAKDYPITDEDTPIITRGGVNIYQWTSIDGNANTTGVSSLSTLVDFDGDGILDCINAWDSWYENGWRYSYDSRYDDNGIWGGVAGTTGTDKVVGVEDGTNDANDVENGVKDGDPLHGWVAWSKNTGSNTAQSYSGTELIQVYEYTGSGDERAIVEGSGKALDVFGAPTVSFSDWDKDGDLDIIAGCWVNDLTYFENIGTRTVPVYITGRPVELPNGQPVQTDMCQVVTSGFDWDNDGDMDLIIGEEDGRVSFIESVGLTADGTPIMKAPVRFQAYSDSLDFGTLISIDSVDWDSDGDEDIVAGEDSGRISMIKNITIEKGLKEGKKKEDIDLSNPIWGEQVYLTNPNGEVYRIIAGYNGSLQGTSEELFGYSKIDTGDWDGDGVLDIISNSIWGIILFHKGIKTTDGTFKAENPVPIEVNWTNGVKYPEWNWWAPGEESLGDDITDPAGRVYKAQWPWWNDVKSENELVVQWRTSPCIVSLPIKDAESGELRDAFGLALIDHEGYLSFFEKCEDGTVNEGQRIFMDADGVTPLRMVGAESTYGQSGRRQFVLADYNKDGKLDYIANNGINAAYRQNVAEEGVYQFGSASTLHTRKIAQHVPSPTVCDWDQDGYLDVLMGDEGGNIYYLKNTLYHTIEKEEEVVGETLPTDFTRITPADFGIADGTYGASDVMERKTSWIGSYNEVLFEARISSMTGYYIGFSKGNWHCLVNSDGTNMRIFDYVTNSSTIWLYPNDAFANTKNEGKTFANADFDFAITMEYGNYDEDTEGLENDLKYGVWFDGVLYKQTYYYLYNVVELLTIDLGIYPNPNATSKTITIDSQEEKFEDFTYVTPSDFGMEGTYISTSSTTQDNRKTVTPINTWNKVIFRTKLNTTGKMGLFLGNDSIYINFQGGGRIRFWNYLSGSTIYFNGGSAGDFYLEPGVLGDNVTSFNNRNIDFMITTEYVDYDGDLTRDDLKMGFWFDGVLYEDQYFYLTNMVAALSNTINLRLIDVGTTIVEDVKEYEFIVNPEITDSIAMNYTLTVDPMILKTGDVSMTFDMNGRDTIKVAGAPTEVGGNVFTYKYTDIMGQDMADKIGVTVNVGSDSKYYEYSVLDYCVDVLNDKYDTYSAETKELVVDLVEYGAALQTYRGVAEKYLFTKVLEEKVPNYATFDKTDGDVQALAGLTAVAEKLTTEQTASETESYGWYSVGLVLNNKVKIRAKFTASDVSNLTVKAVIDGEELEDALEIQGTSTAGVYQVDFDEIYAYEYAKQISFRVYEGNAQVGQTLNYSVDTYLKEMYEYSDKLATLLVAINNYGNAAKAYQFPE